MRLRVISEAAWKIVAVVDDRGDCEVLDALDELASNKKTSATASGFRAWWEHIPRKTPGNFLTASITVWMLRMKSGSSSKAGIEFCASRLLAA